MSINGIEQYHQSVGEKIIYQPEFWIRKVPKKGAYLKFIWYLCS
jgi:hypothetical protein